MAESLIEPIWQGFCALLAEGETDHLPGSPGLSDGAFFEKFVEGLVFGCVHHKVAD